MEGQHKSGDNKFAARKAEIAAAGNRPEDWRAYIIETKLNLKDQPLTEQKKCDIISFLYHKAFRVIPVSNTSLAHAELLVDYATFKSDQSIEDAEKLMTHGRRYLRSHAIIHVASAELELKKGNRDKAGLILKRGSHLGAKPECLIKEAKDRLFKNCTSLLRGDSKENDTLDYSSAHNSSSGSAGSGLELTGDSIQPCIKPMDQGNDKDSLISQWPACTSSTEEVQQGLDTISQYCKLNSYTSAPSLLGTFSLKSQHTTKTKDAAHKDPKTPDPPKLLSRPFQNLANMDISSSAGSRQDSNDASESMVSGPNVRAEELIYPKSKSDTVAGTQNNVQEAPQVPFRNLFSKSCQGPSRERSQGSAMKLHRWHSAIQPSTKWSSSTNKASLLNLKPAQRVRVDQSSPSSSGESDGEEKAGSQTGGKSFSCHKDVSSSSLTFGMTRSQKSLFNTPSATGSAVFGTTSGKIFTLPQNADAPVSVKKSLYREADNHKSTEENRNGTYQVNNATYNKPAFTKETKVLSEFGNPQSSSQQPGQQMPSEQNFSAHEADRHRNQPPADTSKSAFVLPTSMSTTKSQQLFANVPPKCVNAPVASNVPSDGHDPNKGQVSQPPQCQEPKAVASVAGSIYSVPAHDSQAMPGNMITPAKQTSKGQKIIYVKGKPYVAIELIGRGGSAKVYQVQDPETLRLRALKVVNLSCASSEVLEGYKNEIALLEKLQHCDRVIKLYSSEYIATQKKLLVVMECGEINLADFISQNAKNKELQSVRVCYLWGHMVQAVQAMHKEGVIHSDLKPANFIFVSGTIKLIDFGIANSLQQDKTSVLKNHVMGTPNYMSPEALMASNGDPFESKPKYKVGTRSDVWSLGCILYQLVYGHTPFQYVRHKLEAIVNPAHEIQFPPVDDPALMDILKKCLTRDVKQRPTTDDLMNHPYITKEKLDKPSNPAKKALLEEEDMSSASPRTLRQYYLKKAEEFQSMASMVAERKK